MVVGFCQESVVFCIGGQFWVLNNARMGTRLIFFQGAQKWPVLGQNWLWEPKILSQELGPISSTYFQVI